MFAGQVNMVEMHRDSMKYTSGGDTSTRKNMTGKVTYKAMKRK